MKYPITEKAAAMFPDVPTKRGTKHVLETIDALKKGYLSHKMNLQ